MSNFTQDPNCVGAWLFTEGSGESVEDFSPNTNTGTFKAAGEPAWDTTDVPFAVSGVAPNSVDMDATDDYIQVADHTSVQDLGPMSYVCWYYGDGSGSRYFYSKVTTDGGIIRFFIGATLGSEQLFFGSSSSGSLNNPSRDTNALYTSNGSWNHYAVTWDGSLTAANIHMYVNGVEASGYSATADGVTAIVSDVGNAIRLGDRTAGLRPLNGKLTDVGLFSRVLSLAEIQEIRNYGLAGRAHTATVTQSVIRLTAGALTASKQVNKTAQLTQSIIRITSGSTLGEIPTGVDTRTATTTQSFISITAGAASASRTESRIASLTKALISVITNATTASRIESRTASLTLQNIFIITNTTTASKGASKTAPTVQISITLIANNLSCSRTAEKIATLTQSIVRVILGTATVNTGVTAVDFGITLLVESRIEKQPVFNSRISKFIEDKSPFENRLTLKSQLIN